MHIHDLIGIGFGPSNIALAIALREHGEHNRGRPVDALFIERQPDFAWHRNMLLKQAHMQISFMKDLVTLRNPRSAFTFINYLHTKGRLQDFINLKTFFPSRHEFNDYLAWAASHFEDSCAYGETVESIVPEVEDGAVHVVRVVSRTSDGMQRVRRTRSLALGIGGREHIPDVFAALRDDPRVFHSSTYLQNVERNGSAQRVAIIGAGQSAAELFMDLQGRHQAPCVDLIMRARAIRPSDDSPFVNEVFNAEFVDHIYSRTTEERAQLLKEFWHTNYASPDLELIEQIFKVFYEQRVAGQARHRFLRRHEVSAVRATAQAVQIDLRDLNEQREFSASYDAIVLATGYERAHHKALLAPLAPYLGNFDVDRDYRLRADAALRVPIFLQGACETSHGLSDTLLSLIAVRSDEIRSALLTHLVPPRAPAFH